MLNVRHSMWKTRHVVLSPMLPLLYSEISEDYSYIVDHLFCKIVIEDLLLNCWCEIAGASFGLIVFPEHCLL